MSKNELVREQNSMTRHQLFPLKAEKLMSEQVD